jgi:uncharacterized protein YgiM (DUF1202 family)
MGVMRVVIILAIAVMLSAVLYADGKKHFVTARCVKMHSTPGWLGTVVSSLDYGDAVVIVGRKDAWVRVRDESGKNGWIHEAALRNKKFGDMKPGASEDTEADEVDMTLATRAFSEEVEQEYRKRNAAIDFTWVDAMERWVISPEECQEFCMKGELRSPQGGER